jgi:hypothetical protein
MCKGGKGTGTARGSQLDCSSYDSIALLAYLELPETRAALYAAPSPYYLMYYFE